MFFNPNYERQALASAALNPLPDQPYDLGLGLSQAWADTRSRLLSESDIRMQREAYDDYIDELHQLTGKRLDNPILVLKQGRIDKALFGDDQQARLDAFQDAVAKLAKDRPGQLPIKDRAQMLAELSAKVEQRRLDASQGVNVGWGEMGRFMGQAAAVMTDPVNIASMALGFGGAPKTAVSTLSASLASMGRTAGIEALSNAGAQAWAEPAIAGWNRQMGVDYGLADSAENVAMAGLGGFVLGGGLEGGRQGLQKLLGAFKDAKAKGLKPTPEARGAEIVAETQQARIDDNPFPGEQGAEAHGQAFQRAQQQAQNGEPVDVRAEIDDLKKAYRAVNLDPAGPAFHPLVVLQSNDIGKLLVARGGFRNINQFEVTERGWGLVKVIWGHGEKSADPDHLKVLEDDVLALPEILKSKRPIPNERPGDFATWIVERPSPFGNRRILYGANRIRGMDDHTLVTIHVISPDDDKIHLPLSEGVDAEMVAGGDRAASQGEVSSPPLDTAAASSKSSIQGQSGAPARTIIGPLPPELQEPKRPQTLAAFMARRGLKDEGGWLKQAGVTNKTLPGLLKKEGLDMDDAARMAWEEGFFSEHADRPLPDDLVTALTEELSGGQVRIRPDDETAMADWHSWKQTLDALDRYGIDARGKSMAEAMQELEAARRHASPPFTDDDAALWLSASNSGDFDEAQAMADYNAALAEGADLYLPAQGMADDGTQQIASASNILADFDREIDVFDAAAFCLGK